MSKSKPLDLHDKKITVLGLARQGQALVRYLASQGAWITASDLRPAQALRETLDALQDLDGQITYVLGAHPPLILEGADLVCLSGGVPADAPIVRQALERGIPLSNDAQLFLERCPAPVIGVTGSNGKTTTTTLVTRMLQLAGGGSTCKPFMTWVGGNIGRPLLDRLAKITQDDWVVMELSSFQLELMTVSPSIAAVLNVTPNHLKRHKSMTRYSEAKRHILDFQDKESLALLNRDDPISQRFAEKVQGRVGFFGRQPPRQEEKDLWVDAFSREDTLYLKFEGQVQAICPVSALKLRGAHNVANILAACALARGAGAPVEAIRQVATSFRGVPHRLQWVRTYKGVCYYDDSIATSPERTVAALHAFQAPIILLLGGRDKGLSWKEAVRLAGQKARHVIIFGEAAPLIEAAFSQEGGSEHDKLEGMTRTEGLEKAVNKAAEIARCGEIVLLAPGGTSFDAFKDFVARGDRFQALVRAL